MGWDVVKINYLGDWGKQFGLLAVGWQQYGSEEQLARDPLKHLLEVYARINADFKPEQEASKKARDQGQDTSQIESQGLFAKRNDFFRRMEDGDQAALALWKRFRDISIERYVSTYARLNIDFDEYAGESQVKTTSVQSVEQLLQDKGIYEEENGSWMINFEKHGGKGLGTAIIRGRTGTTTYLLRDVAAIFEREQTYKFDKMIYVVSSEQDFYFRRVFKTVELVGRSDLAARLQHINFGMVLGMSSRLGNVQLLSDILDQSRDAMHDVMRRNESKYTQLEDPESTAEAVGISAVMVQDMTGKRVNNYPFDITRMTSFEGDTGPYLQYCHARLNSILRKAELKREDLISSIAENPGALDADVESKQQCVDLLRLMALYPDITTTAMRNLEPSTILTYLFRLTHQVSSCYDVLQVVGAKEGRDTAIARASMFEAARQILENGMRLLGLSPVHR
jgi:arginyl-tRNA synthetase